ncbi:MAG: hypothetical protein LIQ31_09860 [Planctomycetes bacterium]|nr:hypothetical protein [Planctomycetota bacterium]
MRSVDTAGKATAQVSQRGPLRLDLSGLVPTSARQSAPAEAVAVPRSEPASAMPLYQEVSEQMATAVVRRPVGDEPVSAPIITLSTSPVHEPLPEPVPLSALAGMPSFQPLPDSFPTALPSMPASSPVVEPAPTAASASVGKNAVPAPAQWVASPAASARATSDATVTSTRRPSGTMSLPVPLIPATPAAKPMDAPLPFEELPESPTAAAARARTNASDAMSQALAPLPDLSGGSAVPTAALVRSASRQAETPVASAAGSSSGQPLAAPPSRPAAMASMALPERSTAKKSGAKQAAAATEKSAATTDSASKRAGRIPEVTLPQPVPEAVPTPELTAAKTVLMDFSPEALDEVSLPASVRNNEFFKTDFWESKAPAPVPAAPVPPAAKTPSLPIPELPMPAAPNRLEKETPSVPAPTAKAAMPSLPSLPAMPAVEPREPIWVDSMPTGRQQEKETVPEYRYEVTPKQLPVPALKTRIETVEARKTEKEAAPAAPKKVKLMPIGKPNNG